MVSIIIVIFRLMKILKSFVGCLVHVVSRRVSVRNYLNKVVLIKMVFIRVWVSNVFR